MMGNNQHTTPWTATETEWIRTHYPTASREQALAALPGRTIAAIHHKASRLKERKDPETISVTNSATNAGRVRSDDNRARISRSLTGLRHSDATKQKQSVRHRQIAKYGPENPNWKGDSITEDESRWRARRLVPPGLCAECDQPGTDVHHKDENPFNNDLSNLVRLCAKHHRRAHSKKATDAMQTGTWVQPPEDQPVA